MNLENFAYTLPQELIAQEPLKKRDHARLLVVERKTQSIYHDRFSNLEKYLPKNSLLIVNDSKVMPARLMGKREHTGGVIEVFLLNELKDGSFEVLMRPLRRLKNQDRIVFDGGIIATVVDRDKPSVRFNKKNIFKYLSKIGHIPLPPYIKRPDTRADQKDYQTVYAEKLGSVASPTAGLHFTRPLMKRLQKQGFDFHKVTLHINYGTFKPVEEKDIRKHKMHSEAFSISPRTLKAIHSAKASQRKIVAVGTTSCRVLETHAANGVLKGSTNLFIYPGYQFKLVDVLLTNFHLPYSTLLMLVSAFGGMDLVKQAYAQAIQEQYRFYSYGDAMLIL